MNFVQRYSSGDVTDEDINSYIDEWRKGSCDKKLHEFLGMTWEQYSLWAIRPEQLNEILRES